MEKRAISLIRDVLDEMKKLIHVAVRTVQDGSSTAKDGDNKTNGTEQTKYEQDSGQER